VKKLIKNTILNLHAWLGVIWGKVKDFWERAIGVEYERSMTILATIIATLVIIMFLASFSQAAHVSGQWITVESIDEFTDEVTLLTGAKSVQGESTVTLMCRKGVPAFMINTDVITLGKPRTGNFQYRVDKNPVKSLTLTPSGSYDLATQHIDEGFIRELLAGKERLSVKVRGYRDVMIARFSLKGAKEVISKALADCTKISRGV